MDQERSKIWIFSDNEVHRTELEELLARDGYEISSLDSIELVSDEVCRQGPDLLIMAADMLDTPLAHSSLNECFFNSSHGVLFIGGIPEGMVPTAGVCNRGVDYLPTPFTPSEVRLRVNTMVTLTRCRKDVDYYQKMATLGMYTAGLTHEINNYTNFISAGAQGLTHVQSELLQLMDVCERLEKDDSEEAQAEFLRVRAALDYGELTEGFQDLIDCILMGVRSTTDTVNGLRQFTSSDSSGLIASPISDVLESALTVVQPRIKRKIEVSKTIEPELYTLCTPGRLTQAFVNVLNNAIDAILEVHPDHGGNLTVTAKPDSHNGHSGISISITDNGAGMGNTSIDSLFKPYATTKKDRKGLGLPISQNILNDHHGSVRLEGNPGGGATALIWLPLYTPNISDSGGVHL